MGPLHGGHKYVSDSDVPQLVWILLYLLSFLNQIVRVIVDE